METVSTKPANLVSKMCEPAKLAYRMREAAEQASCCERLIWGFIKSGELKAVRLGRSVRITHSELVRFLESRQR